MNRATVTRLALYVAVGALGLIFGVLGRAWASCDLPECDDVTCVWTTRGFYDKPLDKYSEPQAINIIYSNYPAGGNAVNQTSKLTWYTDCAAGGGTDYVKKPTQARYCWDCSPGVEVDDYDCIADP